MLRKNEDSIELTAKESETFTIRRLEQIFNAENSHPRLVGSSGEEIPLPQPVYEALREIIHAMTLGQSITIVARDREMTTQEAADILNVSRPYLIKLLEQGEIPYIKVGSHRRVRSQDIMAYKQQRDAQRRQHLSEFTVFLQNEGFYDEDGSYITY